MGNRSLIEVEAARRGKVMVPLKSRLHGSEMQNQWNFMRDGV